MHASSKTCFHIVVSNCSFLQISLLQIMLKTRSYKVKVPARKITPKNRLAGEKEMVRRVDDWVAEALLRRQCGDDVFQFDNQSKIVASICGVSERSVYYMRGDAGGVDGRTKAVKPMGRPTIKFDDLDRLGLSRLILGYYRRMPPELPTLKKIHSEALEHLDNFPQCSISTLQRLLKTLGFVCKKRNSKMMVYQRMDVVAVRHQARRVLDILEDSEHCLI